MVFKVSVEPEPTARPLPPVPLPDGIHQLIALWPVQLGLFLFFFFPALSWWLRGLVRLIKPITNVSRVCLRVFQEACTRNDQEDDVLLPNDRGGNIANVHVDSPCVLPDPPTVDRWAEALSRPTSSVRPGFTFCDARVVPGAVRESIRSVSEFYTAARPAVQGIVWIKDDTGKWTESCGCWRYRDYLVTVRHGIPHGAEVAISGPNNVVSQIDVKPAYDEDDILVLSVPSSVLSALQLRTATIRPPTDSYVHVVGFRTKANASTGVLQRFDSMAMYTYTGSTEPGFSGSPYMVNDTGVVGMHMSGGAHNIGVAAMYIKMVIERPEAVAKVQSDWYDEEMPLDAPLHARRSRGDPSEFEVQYGDKFYLMDEEELGNFKKMLHFRRTGKGNTRDNEAVHQPQPKDPSPECEEEEIVPQDRDRFLVYTQSSLHSMNSTLSQFISHSIETSKRQTQILESLALSMRPVGSNQLSSTSSPPSALN